MIHPFHEIRCRRLIDQAIRTFELNLSGLTVLTEAATGYYMLTPLIAALAGSSKVLALTRDSRYGKAGDIEKMTVELAQRWGVADLIEVLFSRNDARIGSADIVTNLGFVRPLNATFLQQLKPTAVIPLMWETWEYRAEDMDLDECRRRGIPVLGTNEHHPSLGIFEYIGFIAMKLLFEVDVEILRSTIVVLGDGEFAEQTVSALSKSGAQVIHLLPYLQETLWSNEAKLVLQHADAIVVVEHHNRRVLIGSESELTVQELHQLNPGLTIIHICGNVDRDSLVAANLACHPVRFAVPGFMSVATDYVGPRPLLDLHTAGLKVGQELAHARRNSLTAWDAELAVLARLPLAQGFTGYHHTKV